MLSLSAVSTRPSSSWPRNTAVNARQPLMNSARLSRYLLVGFLTDQNFQLQSVHIHIVFFFVHSSHCFKFPVYFCFFSIQKVMACRRELVEYDQQQREAVAAKGQVPVPTGAKPKDTSVENKSSKASSGSETSKREG